MACAWQCCLPFALCFVPVRLTRFENFSPVFMYGNILPFMRTGAPAFGSFQTTWTSNTHIVFLDLNRSGRRGNEKRTQMLLLNEYHVQNEFKEDIYKFWAIKLFKYSLNWEKNSDHLNNLSNYFFSSLEIG